MLRRFIALVTFLAMAGSITEPALGVLRDGTVHHEAVTSAASHAERAAGGDGHENGARAGHPHDGDHQHGTGADHCTHQHGHALVAGDRPVLQPAAPPPSAPGTESLPLRGRYPLAQFHPPRV